MVVTLTESDITFDITLLFTQTDPSYDYICVVNT